MCSCINTAVHDVQFTALSQNARGTIGLQQEQRAMTAPADRRDASGEKPAFDNSFVHTDTRASFQSNGLITNFGNRNTGINMGNTGPSAALSSPSFDEGRNTYHHSQPQILDVSPAAVASNGNYYAVPGVHTNFSNSECSNLGDNRYIPGHPQKPSTSSPGLGGTNSGPGSLSDSNLLLNAFSGWHGQNGQYGHHGYGQQQQQQHQQHEQQFSAPSIYNATSQSTALP